MTAPNDFELLLPQLPTKEEWIKTISELEGSEKEAVIVRAKGYNLLGDFRESKATFERIAWLNLWAKAMTALESAIKAFQHGSDWVLQTITRSTFEWFLHALVLIEPISDLYALEKSSHKVVVSSRSREYSYKMTVERLRAYSAWCLWSDKIYYSELIHPKTLARIWDPSDAKKILLNEKALEQYERLFGRLESETDKEKLIEGQKEMDRLYKKKIERIDQWLEDAKLKKWSDKILEASRKIKGTVSFFNLFDHEATVPKRLQKHDLRFTYAEYSKSSMAMHGSTMEQFILINDSVVAPKIQTAEQGDEATFVQIISECNHVFFLLARMNEFVLQKPEFRI